MSGLNHDFLLLSVREYAYGDYMKLINHPKAIHIHDDVMDYLHDTMNWITCYNPARRMMKHKGLNFYGPTVIKKEGAANAAQIFTAWASLFAVGPKRIKLIGDSNAVITISRDEVVKNLRTVAR
jgi:hypothetical protein